MKLRNIIYTGIGVGLGAASLYKILQKRQIEKNPARGISIPFESDLASIEAGTPLNDSSESYDSDLASRMVEFSGESCNSGYSVN